MLNHTNLDGSLNDLKILVVDDMTANLEVITETLLSAHYSVSAVTSGKRALKQLAKQIPDLILLDIQMPEMDGFETCRQIKDNPQTASVPIIFITALSDTESIVKGFSLGAVDYITKPFREVELLARVSTHLKLHGLTEQLEQQVKKRTAELETTLKQLKHSQIQIVNSEKMASLGTLVAGVAHEINNPVGFINGSVQNAKNYLQDLQGQIDIYQQHYPNAVAPVSNYAEDIDLDFVREDFPKLLTAMENATKRINKISTSLRTFSRADAEHKVSANIHDGLDGTLLILKYRLKANDVRPAIEIVKDYGDLPKLDCFLGQLNQVFMNILANAIDAFDEASQAHQFAELEASPNRLTIRTQAEDRHVTISIADNGPGIPDTVQAKIFDHLFTTKQVGRGTGLGLAIAHQIVTEAHGGELQVFSEIDQGTEFCIRLPI